MKTAKGTLMTFLKKVVLLFVIPLFLYNCEKDEVIANDSDIDSAIVTSTLNCDVLEKNIPLQEKLTSVRKGIKKAYESREEHSNFQNLYINTEAALYIENASKNYHSYTFKVFRDQPTDVVENLVLSLEEDGTYKALLYAYDLTKEDKIALDNEQPVGLINKTYRTTISEKVVLDDLFNGTSSNRNRSVCQTILMCPYGGVNHEAGSACVAANRGNLKEMTFCSDGDMNGGDVGDLDLPDDSVHYTDTDCKGCGSGGGVGGGSGSSGGGFSGGKDDVITSPVTYDLAFHLFVKGLSPEKQDLVFALKTFKNPAFDTFEFYYSKNGYSTEAGQTIEKALELLPYLDGLSRYWPQNEAEWTVVADVFKSIATELALGLIPGYDFVDGVKELIKGNIGAAALAFGFGIASFSPAILAKVVRAGAKLFRAFNKIIDIIKPLASVLKKGLKSKVTDDVLELVDDAGNIFAKGDEAVKTFLKKFDNFSVAKFDNYIKNIKTRNPAGAPDAPFRKYQEKVAGLKEYELTGGNSKIWADGVDRNTGKVLESKFIGNPSTSPFIPGSSAPQFLRDKITNEIRGEFQRYADIIKNADTPMTQLEVITNNPAATEFFEKLLREFDIPATVIVKP